MSNSKILDDKGQNLYSYQPLKDVPWMQDDPFMLGAFGGAFYYFVMFPKSSQNIIFVNLICNVYNCSGRPSSSHIQVLVMSYIFPFSSQQLFGKITSPFLNIRKPLRFTYIEKFLL